MPKRTQHTVAAEATPADTRLAPLNHRSEDELIHAPTSMADQIARRQAKITKAREDAKRVEKQLERQRAIRDQDRAELSRCGNRLQEIQFLGIRPNSDGSYFQEQEGGIFKNTPGMTGHYHLVFKLPHTKNEGMDQALSRFVATTVYEKLGLPIINDPNYGPQIPSAVFRGFPEIDITNDLRETMEKAPDWQAAGDPILFAPYIFRTKYPDCEESNSTLLIVPISPEKLHELQKQYHDPTLFKPIKALLPVPKERGR